MERNSSWEQSGRKEEMTWGKEVGKMSESAEVTCSREKSSGGLN